MNKFIDTHAHIYHEYYEDIPELLNKIEENNINYVINDGCDDKTNREVLELSKKHSMLYCTLGIHPENVDGIKESDFQFIIDNLDNEKVVAIGEIGLDYHFTKENRDAQINLFEKQLAIAEKYHMPVVVHSREATEDTINSLKKFNVSGVIHSFSGSLETAKIYEKMGFYFGINGVITFKSAKIKEIYKDIPIENIVLETDSPYLSPEPVRGTQNNSANINYIAEFVANIYGISLDELSSVTNHNAKKIFTKIER